MKSFSVSAGSPKNLAAALVFQHQKLALDGADGCLGDVAETLRGLADRRQRISSASALLAAIGTIASSSARRSFMSISVSPLLVGDAERDVEHAFLHVVQIEHARQQQRSHFRDGGAHRMALLAEHVPEHRRELVGLECEAHLAGALDDEILGFADFGDAGEVALDVGGEYRNAGARKSFRHHLQRHGLSGSGGAGDEAVPVGKRRASAMPAVRPCR